MLGVWEDENEVEFVTPCPEGALGLGWHKKTAHPIVGLNRHSPFCQEGVT